MVGFIKKYKFVLIAAAVALTVLVIAFLSGGGVDDTAAPYSVNNQLSASSDSAVPIADTVNSAQEHTTAFATVPTQNSVNQSATQASADPSRVPNSSALPDAAKYSSPPTDAKKKASAKNNRSSAAKATAQPKQIAQNRYKTDPVPQGKPQPVEPQEQTEANRKTTVTVSISCATVLPRIEKLDEDKRDIIPADGWILKPVSVTINDGESVFELLKRVCRTNKIHMEFSFTPVYNSAYIEGIGNLYEFDCGSASGWMYKVNSWFPNYGCSRYVLHGGETVEWQYTTNLGKDIGGSNQQWEE